MQQFRSVFNAAKSASLRVGKRSAHLFDGFAADSKHSTLGYCSQ